MGIEQEGKKLYQPTEEEIQKAEDMMTDKQKRSSEDREFDVDDENFKKEYFALSNEERNHVSTLSNLYLVNSYLMDQIKKGLLNSGVAIRGNKYTWALAEIARSSENILIRKYNELGIDKQELDNKIKNLEKLADDKMNLKERRSRLPRPIAP